MISFKQIAVLFCAVSAIAFAALSLVNCSSRKYEIVDYFIDTSDYGKMVFMFIETESTSEQYLKYVAETIFSTHPDLQHSDSMLIVMVAHFFSRADTAVPPGEVIEKLKSDYPNTSGLEKRLDYIPAGYVYTAFSRQIPDLGLPQDSLFKTAVFVPKLGIKARDVLKKIKKKSVEPKFSTDTTDRSLRLDSLVK